MSAISETPSLPAKRFQAPLGGFRGLLGKVSTFIRQDRARVWLQRKAVATWMNVLIAAAAGVTVATAGLIAQGHWPELRTWDIGALKLFALWCLSFLPGWLYVRFIGMRAKALWNEYVLNLHRLGWDLPENLPEPPVTSEFHRQWQEKHDPKLPSDNIYRQKFEVYYGRDVTRTAIKGPDAALDEKSAKVGGRNEDFRVSGESLFPVFLLTAVLAVGWSAVLWDTRFISAPDGAWDVLKYGFIGAYAFVTGMLIRRFYQSDLRPSAYASAVLRIILVLLIVTVLHQVADGTTTMASHAELAVAFVIGFFPLVGIQLLQRVTSKMLGVIVPSITSEYPLDQLDGFNLWYEARLIEEGVEDMQNLTTMNLVDVILHTRVPPGRLVDWTDQAFLLTHLDKTDRIELKNLRRKLSQQEWQQAAPADIEPCAEFGAAARLNLRRVGIRTATDLLKAFSKEVKPSPGSPFGRTFARRPEIKRLPLPESQLRLLVAVLGAEPGLVPIWNWQRKGVAANRQVPSVHNDQTDANSPNGYEGEPLQLEQRPDTTASAGRAGNRTGHERGPSHTRRTSPSGSSPPAR